MRCPACGHENREAARFCDACGALLARLCPDCGTPPREGARFCDACGKVLVDPESPAAAGAPAPTESGERRQLTVLFCDLVGSTELSTRLDPEELGDLLRGYQAVCVAVIERFEGRVAQYLGDGLLVYFGYPQAHEDDAERAVRAALGILAAISDWNAERGTDRRLSLRIGVHTGPVVVRELGAGEKRETLALGETTNLTARLKAAAAPDTVVISAATLRLVRGVFVLEALGALPLKGIAEPVEVYRVVQPSGMRSRLAAPSARLTPLVARDLELGVLLDRWERVQEGQGQTVLVSGEAGVGKTRLVHELRERLADVPHTWLECRSTPYTEATPFHPVVELLEQGLVFTASESGREKLAKLERALVLGGLAQGDTLPLFANFLGLPLPDDVAPLDLHPDALRRRTLEGLVTWSLKLTELQAVVVLMEDLHWSDPSSLELLARLVEQSPTARLLLVCTARPEFQVAWGNRANVTTLSLARLTKRQTREMFARVAASRALPDPLTEVLVARADGVPLYVEELAKAVLEAPALRDAPIPSTLQDSLMARLDRLSSAKDVAQRAAVLGREFRYELLAAVSGLDEAALVQGLERLVEAEIVFQRGAPPGATYTFKHALLQEAAYASLLKRTRQELHARVVRALAERFPERHTSEPEWVARHAEAAGLTEEAALHYRNAGEQAQDRSAHAEAVCHLRRAIELLTSANAGAKCVEHEIALQLLLANSLIATRGYGHAETRSAYERARALCEDARDPVRLGLALNGLSLCHTNGGDAKRGREVALLALEIAEQTAQTEISAAAHVNLEVPEHFEGRFSASLASGQTALALFRAVSKRGSALRTWGNDQEVGALGFAAWNSWHLGRPDRALSLAREAVALARRLAHPFSVAYALWFESVVHNFRRDARRQQALAEECLELSRAHGFPLWEGLGRVHRAHARLRLGAGDGALEEVQQGIALAAGTNVQGGTSGLLMLLADAQLIAGRHADARGAVEFGLTLSARAGQPFLDAELHRLGGEVARIEEANAEAEKRFQRALEIACAQESRAQELRASLSLARLWRELGRNDEARALLARPCASFREGLDTGDLVEAQALLEQLG